MDAMERLRRVTLNVKQATTLLDILQLVGALALLILLGIFFARHYPMFRRRKERLELFDHLCTIHGLSLPEQRLIEELVEQEKLENKLMIFVCKSIHDRRIAAATGARRDKLEALASRLFGKGGR